MLRNRIITALILAPLVLSGVLFLPLQWFAALFWLVAATAAYEYAGLMGLHGAPARLAGLVPFAIAAWWLFSNPQWFGLVLSIGWVCWGVAFIGVMSFPRGQSIYRQPLVMGLFGLAIFLAAWVSLVAIRSVPAGGIWLIWLLLLVWGADIGAYFAGRALGRTPLAPSVSPGKTWEGVIGGMLLALLVCGVFVAVWQSHSWPWLAGIVVLVGISVVGDLFESVMKRTSAIKDSGTLLPGHGGMLDRVDSLLAALPFFALLLVFN